MKPARRRLLQWAGGALLVLLLGLGAAAGLRAVLLKHRAAAGTSAPVVVRLPRGSGLRQVARLLSRAGVVDHPRLFVLAARLSNRTTGLKAGEYRLSAAMSYGAILEHLHRGRVLLHQVVIPEGFTLEQIARRLAARGLVDKQRFLALARDPAFARSLGIAAPSLEGYLFPATYRLPRGLGERAVLARMVRRFLKEWRRLAPLARRRGMNRHQVVTLASIIEREAKLPFERRLISAVYHNRLKKNMPLQADPTVIYGLEGFDGNLTRRDLASDTPYNTYLHRGLPPGPICSPGAASLKAALDPAPVDYLYFVARGDGSHHFSASYRQHARAVRRYQKRRRP